MLAGVEYEQCESLLRQLSPEALKSLKDTVTRNLIATEDVEETITAILHFSVNARELLLRKKMKRNYLFQYLYLVGVPVDPKSDKDVLVNTILNYWGLLRGAATPNVTANNQMPPEGSSCSSATSLSQEDTDRLGVEFVDMFYQRLNNMAIDGDEPKLGSRFFDDDCKLILTTTSSAELQTVQEFSGAKNVHKALYELAHTQKLCFACGSNGKASLSGDMVIVHISGDLRRIVKRTEEVGIFEQTFYLKLNAVESWMIAFCELNIIYKG